MSESNSPFQFPCHFPIKVMADQASEIEKLVKETLDAHVTDPSTISIEVRESKTGKYKSVTAIFLADSKEQLDAIYQILSKHPLVKMVL